jgi:histone H3/H4
VELFAHHAGRKSVMVDDVLLAGMFQEIWSFV